MKISYLFSVLTLCGFATTSLFANAGVFRGSGQTVVLDSTAKIQMVEEIITMIPMRGNYPVDSSCRNMDLMKFHCIFKLRNLTEEKLTVQVGFPISTEALWFQDNTQINQTEVIARFGFVAGTKENSFPIRYVPFDKKKKFSNIFLWNMNFDPKEEIELIVSYTMHGYMGLASTRKLGVTWEHELRQDYLTNLEFAIGEGHMYVTETGKSWAGRIEKAAFRIIPFDFEKYLTERGALEGEKATSTKEIQLQMINSAPMIRRWQPKYEQWSVVNDKRGRNLYLELVFAPFEPKSKADDLVFYYIFPCMPTTVEQFNQLLALVKKNREKRLAMFEKQLNDKNCDRKHAEKMIAFWKSVEPYTPAVERNLADAVLEFHGIHRDNPDIKDFLEIQCWYPVEKPLKINDEYREFLLRISCGEEKAKR